MFADGQTLPKCSPPIPVDLALDLQVHVDGGGAAEPGSTGQLVFTVRNRSTIGGPSPFGINHYPQLLQFGAAQTLRLTSADGVCQLSEWTDPYGYSAGFMYVLLRIAQGPAPGEEMTCRLNFEVPGSVVYRQHLGFTVRPGECRIDRQMSDNTVGFTFGGPDPAPAAEGVPLIGGRYGWLAWGALIAGLFIFARRAQVRSR